MPRTTRRTASSNPNGGANGVSDAEVARRAYEIYQGRGANDGADLDDWLEAERQLKLQPGSVAGAGEKSRRKKSADQAH